MTGGKVVEGDRLVVVTLNVTKIERIFKWAMPFIAAIAALIAIATTISAMKIAYLPFPYMDSWGALSTNEFFSTLFQQHNEHRLVLFKLMSVLDNKYTDGTYRVNFFTSVALQALHASLIAFLAWWGGLRRTGEIICAGALAFGLLFWGAQSENFFWAFQTQFFAVYFFGTLAFVTLAGFSTWIGVGLAAAAALLAVGSMSNGVLVPALLPVLAICLRRPRSHIVALALVGAAMIGAYLAGFHTVSHHSDPISSLGKPLQIITYAMAYLGNPWMQLLHDAFGADRPQPAEVEIAVRAGICGAIGLIVASALLLRKGAATPPRLALLFVIVFIGATALVTGLGRVDFGIHQALASRYLTPALIAWAALAILLWSLTPLNWRLVVQSLATLLLLVLTTTGNSITKSAHDTRMIMDSAATAALARVRDDEAFAKVFPSSDFVASRVSILEEERLGIFSWPSSSWIDTPLLSHVTILPASACIGAFDEAKAMSDKAPQSAYKVTGWAWNLSSRAAPTEIVLADKDGRVVGYALTDTSRPDVRAAVSKVKDEFVGWRGHLKLSKPDDVTAYALTADGKSACAIGSKAIE